MTNQPGSTPSEDSPRDTFSELDEAEALKRAADCASSADDAGDGDGDGLADGFVEEPEPEELRPAQLEPVSGWMLRVALALIVVLLVTTASFVFFLLTLHKAPRSAAERDLAAAESAVRDKPGDAQSWTKLVYAYSRVRRFDEALATAEKGRRVTKSDALLLAEAGVLRSAGRFKEAVATYDRARTAIEAAQAAAVVARKKQGILVPLGDTTMASVYYGRAISRHALGEVGPAIADLEKAVAIAPEQAYLFVTLGDYYAETRATAKAEAAYRNALRYVPDYPEALSGLKRLTGGE